MTALETQGTAAKLLQGTAEAETSQAAAYKLHVRTPS